MESRRGIAEVEEAVGNLEGKKKVEARYEIRQTCRRLWKAGRGTGTTEVVIREIEIELGFKAGLQGQRKDWEGPGKQRGPKRELGSLDSTWGFLEPQGGG